MSPVKLGVIVLWLVFAAGFVAAPGSRAAEAGRIAFWAMAAAHVVECVVFLPRLRRAPGSLATHLAQTFVFGVAHLRELPAVGSEP